MGEDATRKSTLTDQLQCLLQACTSITDVLVSNGYSAHLLKALSDIWTSEEVNQARVDVIRKHFSKTCADALLDTLILDPHDQSIAYDAEYLGDEKEIEHFGEDFFSL